MPEPVVWTVEMVKELYDSLLDEPQSLLDEPQHDEDDDVIECSGKIVDATFLFCPCDDCAIEFLTIGATQ